MSNISESVHISLIFIEENRVQMISHLHKETELFEEKRNQNNERIKQTFHYSP